MFVPRRFGTRSDLIIAQFEHTVLVTRDGHEILTREPGESAPDGIVTEWKR